MDNNTNHDPKQIVNRLLQTALDTHTKREAVYGGKTTQNVFVDTAAISTIVLRKELTSKDIAFIFSAMKLARYGNIMELIELFKTNPDETVKLNNFADDSILDGIVYLALTERERNNLHNKPLPFHGPTTEHFSTHGATICPFFIWQSEDKETHLPLDISLSICNHPDNPDQSEGNCSLQNCPLIKAFPPLKHRTR